MRKSALWPSFIIAAALAWCLIGLHRVETRHGAERLYGLLALTDSVPPGHGEVHWKPGGRRDAILYVGLPYAAGVCALGALFGVGVVRKRDRWLVLLLGLIACLVVLSLIFTKILFDVIGVFV